MKRIILGGLILLCLTGCRIVKTEDGFYQIHPILHVQSHAPSVESLESELDDLEADLRQDVTNNMKKQVVVLKKVVTVHQEKAGKSIKESKRLARSISRISDPLLLKVLNQQLKSAQEISSFELALAEVATSRLNRAEAKKAEFKVLANN